MKRVMVGHPEGGHNFSVYPCLSQLLPVTAGSNHPYANRNGVMPVLEIDASALRHLIPEFELEKTAWQAAEVAH